MAYVTVAKGNHRDRLFGFMQRILKNHCDELALLWEERTVSLILVLSYPEKPGLTACQWMISCFQGSISAVLRVSLSCWEGTWQSDWYSANFLLAKKTGMCHSSTTWWITICTSMCFATAHSRLSLDYREQKSFSNLELCATLYCMLATEGAEVVKQCIVFRHWLVIYTSHEDLTSVWINVYRE